MIIDVNASLGVWPFQRLQLRTAAQLDRHFADLGVNQAWVSSIEAVLCPDIDACDEELARRLRPHRRLRMVPTINPILANWPKSLAKWAARGVHAVKFYPNYHQYPLAAPAMREAARQAASMHMTLLIQARMEDERGMYPPLHIKGMAVDDIAQLARDVPEASIVALSLYYGEAVKLAAQAPNVLLDLSFVETCDTLKTLLRGVAADRVVFGSHTPLHCTQAELMKLTAADLPERQLRLIRSENARRLAAGR